MSASTIYVGFDGRQVAVSSKVRELIEGLLQRFRPMLEPRPTHVIGRLAMHKEDERYVLSGDCDQPATEAVLANALERLNHEIGLQFIKAYPELLWIHAGAAAREGAAVMFAGSWGRGKSTLAAGLTEHGWKFLSDDLLPYDPVSCRVVPFPRLPSVRQHTGVGLPRERVGELPKKVLDIDASAVAGARADLCSIVFPSYAHNAPNTCALCSPAEAVVELLRNSLNFLDHRGRAVRSFCRLLNRVPAFRLQFSEPKSALQLVTDSHATTL